MIHPTKAKHIRGYAVVLLILFGVVCSVTAADRDQDGIGGTGNTSVGPVQRFGSIFVNGREYFLSEHTSITADGASLNERDLRLGDVVVVQGRVDAASGRSQALRIAVEQALQGLVEKVDVEARTVTVLGQVVRVMPDTFGETPDGKPFSLTQVRVNESIAVSGLMREDGSWTATRISRPVVPTAGGVPFMLRGTLRALDRARGALTIGTQTLTVTPQRLPPDLAVGQSVYARGYYGAGLPQAQAVQLERRDLGPVGSHVEIAGHIQSHPALGQAVCNGTLVRYGEDTQFIGGMTAQLTPGMPVAIQGILRADGSVAAARIMLRADFLHAELPRQPTALHEKGPRPLEQQPPRPERPSIERPSIDRPQRPFM